MKTLKDCKVGDFVSFPGLNNECYNDYQIVAEVPFMNERVFVVGLTSCLTQWLVYEDGSWINPALRTHHSDSLFFVKEPVKKVTDAKIGDFIVNGYDRDVLVIGKILCDEEVFLIVRYTKVGEDEWQYVVNSKGGYALFKGFESPFFCSGNNVFTL